MYEPRRFRGYVSGENACKGALRPALSIADALSNYSLDSRLLKGNNHLASLFVRNRVMEITEHVGARTRVYGPVHDLVYERGAHSLKLDVRIGRTPADNPAKGYFVYVWLPTQSGNETRGTKRIYSDPVSEAPTSQNTEAYIFVESGPRLHAAHSLRNYTLRRALTRNKRPPRLPSQERYFLRCRGQTNLPIAAKRSSFSRLEPQQSSKIRIGRSFTVSDVE